MQLQEDNCENSPSHWNFYLPSMCTEMEKNRNIMFRWMNIFVFGKLKADEVSIFKHASRPAESIYGNMHAIPVYRNNNTNHTVIYSRLCMAVSMNDMRHWTGDLWSVEKSGVACVWRVEFVIIRARTSVVSRRHILAFRWEGFCSKQ